MGVGEEEKHFRQLDRSAQKSQAVIIHSQLVISRAEPFASSGSQVAGSPSFQAIRDFPAREDRDMGQREQRFLARLQPPAHVGVWQQRQSSEITSESPLVASE